MHPLTMANLALQIERMHCGACVRRVTQVLNGLPATHAEAVQVGSARVITQASPEEITAALTSAGFPAQVTSTAG